MKKPEDSIPELTQKIDFTDLDVLPGELAQKDEVEHIKHVSHFEREDFLPSTLEEADGAAVTPSDDEVVSSTKHGSRFFKTKLMFALLSVLFFAESFLFINELVADFNVMGAAWLSFFLFVFGSFVTTGFNEYRSLSQLKKAEDTRRQSHYFSNSYANGSASTFCQTLCLPLEENCAVEIDKWHSVLLSHYSDKEVIELFDNIVVAQADKKALSIVRKQMAATAALIGVSPLASVDMVIVFIRHWQMINQISKVYGMRLGYVARVSLLRRIVKHMIYAGSSEILLDASVYALGSSLTAKLSTKVAQGLGAGALTGRLGLQVMAQCRPIEWKESNKTTLTSITKHILADLRNL